MKKIVSLLLAVLLLIGLLTACGGSGIIQKPDDDTTTQTEESKQQNSTETQETPSVDNWGRIDAKSVINSNGIMRVIFRWPAVAGDDAHTGRVANQNDGTIVLVDNFVPGDSPEVDSIDQVFPAYFEQTAKVFDSFYKGAYSEGKFTIESTEKVTIGEHEFYKHTGKHSYKYDGNERNTQFVIYLTATKLTGGYIYWLVADVTADQSAFAQVEENAYKIALSIKEEK